MFITWGNEATSTTGDAATGTMSVQVDMHLYNNNVKTEAAPVARAFKWQIWVVNPDDTNYFNGLKDIWDSTMSLTWTTGNQTLLSLDFRYT